MLAHVASAAVMGVESYLVRVEVALTSGLPSFTVVGLPQGAVREGRERVSAALQSAGVPLPLRRITVNLAPADVRKEGSALDLPIALGLLACAGAVAPERLEGWAFVGELGLDGGLGPVRGALSMAAACRAEGLGGLVPPRDNAPEAAVVEGLEVVGAADLQELLAHLDGGPCLPRVRTDPARLLQTRP
ncbi:MAG: ATP-dependent protease, partial [Gemmatimonadetes bacterium]|nr:ATP-dependent protease [Gemmatimonadota bacterium]